MSIVAPAPIRRERPHHEREPRTADRDRRAVVLALLLSADSALARAENACKLAEMPPEHTER